MQLEQVYFPIFIFGILGVAFVAAAFVTSFLLAPRKPNAKKLSTYECGEVPAGPAWVQYNVRYYFFVLVFLIFDVETMFLFPWAVTIKSVGVVALIEMFVFLIVLLLGFVYAWRKGALEWT